ncbi:mitochondrial protein [Rhodocollybia butyracea]|uniref:Mitochondrial protein n=1 Tax=Rhodocollybia butyracea TaxID=206335 RepID=A0A9P5Q551_9AGAR|nr:mitochondrial protein [Rhodocollybia butyracea]
MAAPSIQKILVVGGNGFIGSAICRAALAKGMQVTSVSSSGRPYTTPKGHSPAWTNKVTWLKGSAHDPSSFSDALSEAHGVVHTLGTILEDGGKYKQALREGNVTQVIGGALSTVFGLQNPLKRGAEGSYEYVNRDSALRVCEAFLSSGEYTQFSSQRPFVYISAEDIFRPWIPARYVETKREAELGIEAMLSTSPGKYRGVYIRPSLVYHAHYRPLTTPAATVLDFSASLHRKVPQGIPTPSQILRHLGNVLSPHSSLGLGASSNNSTTDANGASLGSPLESIANAMSIPPIHIDHVADAVAISLENSTVSGVIGVKEMRELFGWWPEDEGLQSSDRRQSGVYP